MASVGRNIVFPIKNADGTPFHNLVLRKATVDSVVMSLGDKITGDVYYKDNTLQCSMQEYVEYNNVKYTIVNPPTIVREGLVKDNSDLKGMTKYSFEFYHPMYILGNLPFSDVAVSNDENKYLSQNKTFSWIGKPQDYINKINKNLEGTEWIVVKSDRFPKEKDDELSDVLSFDNNTIADALKTGYEAWGLPYVVSQINIGEPYYSQGKRFKVEFGLPSNEILVDNEPYIFQFGHGVGLKNNSRTPRNNKIITRIAGYGSENNIPYGYPQIRWYGDQSATQTPAGYPIYDGIVGGVVRKLIKHPFTRTHLMPSVYSQTVFNKVSPYLANGSANPDYNPNEEIVDYYDAVYSQEYQYINEINLLAPSYEIHEFADIKPELDSDRKLGIVSAIPLNQDLTPASQWDDTYDAEKDEYVQSYFKITLPQLSFDLYACASIMEEMQVNMRSGACIGCTFPIQVDWEDYKRNFYDANGNFLPDGSQRDLTKYPKSNLGQIDIVVQKETQTFGTLMPNIYQQPKENDLFVILGISLPLEYITNAEERLDDVMKSYMLENNVYYYDYPLKFDEHFLATHKNILSQIRPNSIIRFGFKGYSTPLELFVKQLTVKYGEGVLPQYDITLTDNIEVVLNQIGKVADDVEKLGSLVAILRQTYNRNIWSELDKKLSKVKDDSTPHKLGMGEMQVDGDGAIGNDLSVGGNLSVTGDTELNGDVNIGNSSSDEALIKAIAKVFQQIKSNNYSGDSPFDIGWMIKNADANHGNASYMVVDNLFVRMKAIFTELEIRKISYAGGNIILSHAGSTLVKVVPLTTTMQPTVVDGKLTISGNLARVENNRLILDNGTVSGNRLILDGSQEVLYAYRCYIKKDDGTTATENWWIADDQARCQTFNIDETGTYHDVSNSFYWRRVMNVGSEVPIGETTDELMDYVDLSALDCITGSTVPQAGDVIVQMGNRTDVSRQGFISLEVYGDDAPAFKVYKYVNGYTLENKMPIIISPKNTSMKVQHYEIETDYGTFPAVKERGEWSLIDEHKCYYYDRVQHNGSSWLCVYPSGLTPEYTTDEPSLSSVYWKVDAKAGEPAPSYTEDWFAWSNVASVVDVTTEPTPNSGWLQTIGAQGSDTYLWRKLIRYIWNPTTRVYFSASTQYFRMSGTNGTSIDINGEVALHTDIEANGYVTPVGGTRHLADDGESYVLQEDWIDSEGVNRQGHLFMWSTESTRWIPLGKFQGDAGKTYYTHVAWATSVTYNQSTGEVTNVSGFVITKAPNDTTHFWMGVYVDENSAIDPSDALLYTWSYTKGETGTSVFVDEENSSTEYAISTSGTQRPVSGWQSNPPVVPKGQFLWTRVTTVFTDTSQTVSYSVSYMGTDVQIDASRTFVRYSTAKTATQPADNTFTLVTPPSLSEGEYLWSLSQTAYVGVSDALKSYAVSRFGINGKVPQLILSPSLIAIPTDTDGVVLEDFRKEIAVSMKTYSDVLALKSVDFIANENVVVEASTLIAMAWSGASVNNGRLVNVEGSVNNGRLTISADDYAVVPTKIVVKATKGTTLTERTVSIFATAWDEDGNEYNGYNELTVQRQYRAGKPQFPSMVFKRSVTKPATPIGGTYTNPIPEGWEDGIPSGTGIVWASVCTFYGDGTSSRWSEPQAQIDTDNLDLEFSASSTEPSAPTGDVPFADHESEGWYDPTSPNLPEMVIWRAERKVKNGAYDGDWVVTRIYGEKGDTGVDAINVALSQFAVLFSQDVSSDDDTAAHAIAQITPETIASQVVVTKGETPITTGVVVSVASTSHFNASGVTITGTTITLDKDGIQVYEESGKYYPYDNGYVDLNVAYNGKNYPLRLQFYVNLMGKFKTTIEGDVETSIASKHTYYLNSDGTALESEVEEQGTYIRSAEENIQRLDEQVNDPTTGLEHKYSEISQNVNKISLKVGQYYNLLYNAFFGELLAERYPYSTTTSITLVSEGTYGGKVIRMGGGNFNETITSSIMGSDTKGYGVYLDKGTYTFQMYAKVQTSYPSTGFAGVELLWDDNADFSTWSSSKIINRIQVTGTSYARYTYTFTLSSARYVGFRMIIDGISIGGTSFNLYIDAVMLEIGSTASSMVSSYGGNQSGAEVGKVQRKLLATGIDIEKGKITNTADQWECQNNSGVKTAWLDDMGNFTVRGVYNNLITVINDSNWDKYIIKIGSGTFSKWYLDILLCGTFVVIESLPSDVVREFNASSDGMLHLPYYANDNYFTRGYTRYLDKSTSTPRLMTADELRMLAGRKMVIKWNAITGISNRAALGYVFRPEVYYGNTTITTDMLNYRLMDLYAGERHCISINPSDTSVNRSPVLYVPRTFFMSFNLVKFHTSQSESNYSWGYIWMADDDSGSASQDDINWT